MSSLKTNFFPDWVRRRPTASAEPGKLLFLTQPIGNYCCAGGGVDGCGAGASGAAGAAGCASGVDAGGVFTGAGVASGFAGIFNFCPTRIWVVVKLFSAISALRLTPKCLAICDSVSPDLTV